MHNSLKTLIENAGKEEIKKRKESQEISGIILGFDNQKNGDKILLKQIIRLKKFVKELIISIPENWDSRENNGLKNEEESFTIKYVERSKKSSPFSVLVFDLLQKSCIYDKILFVSYNHEISASKIEKLIIQECSLCTFLGQKGNFLPSIGYYDKWINRFNIQILKINPGKNLYDLFRVSSDKLFLKLSSTDSIKEWVSEKTKHQSDGSNLMKNLFVPLKFQSELDPQDLVKMIALLQVLKTDIKEKGEMLSKFRIQQVLLLSRKFFNSGNFYIAYQILLFFISNKSKIKNLPENWSIDIIADFGRRQLLEESQFYSKDNLDRFRFLILNDLQSHQLMKETDVGWIEDEISRLQKILSKDNIVCL
ncbi:MAG: hypothetical protein HGN29_01950 [Asgard group archaeon]|nr:hypothetical protein [Asgard group archaeon]